MSRPYHRFVFDTERRRFVGDFEEMYRHEELEGFDSWAQDDLGALDKRVSLAIVDGVPAQRILDVGCGKGGFTALLAQPGREVIGVDISATAVEKASARWPDVSFRVGTVDNLHQVADGRFELVIAMEILSYLEDWREALGRFARMGDRVFLSLYVPPDPIGFVKSFDELREEVVRSFEVEADVVLNGDKLLLLGRSNVRV
jgi:2-polyprenyl-3-methyl-5-hydroxy-6-metoxy-1,4-benzoquinol methylase